MTIDELIAILEMQEEILQFTHFTNEDAWELGNLIVSEAKRRKLPVSVSIQLNNGLNVFRYAADGFSLNDEKWMSRKVNTVKTLERSSLHTYMMLRKNEENLSDWCLDRSEYAASGGGFPIRVEEVGVIGVVAAAGLDHVSDHDLIVKAVSRYLHIDEVPRIRGEM